MAKTFYITTPIYYPSGKFHIGSAYTTCLCDTLNRYKKYLGYDTRFLTGTDEHGLKIQQAAQAAGKTPQDHVDYIAGLAKDLWKLLAIHNDDFIRTTEDRHVHAVSVIFDRLLQQGDIYLGAYKGHYCVQCEAYFTPTQLVDGNHCPDCGRETSILEEETYFLRLSKYADQLLEYIESHPDFIVPETRRNEVIAFIKSGLNDLSVSRTAFDWGIPVSSNPNHVIYVWIDALSNYISALGYESPDPSLFEKYWMHGDEVIHVVGKDILRFHAVYWPIMLMALNIPINFRLVAHGWYMMKDGKMSKSKGNVVYPELLVSRYGLDAFRYYIVREMPLGNDGVFTPEDFVQRINSDLVNDLGNLVSRTVAMANKYFNGTVEKKEIDHPYRTFEADLETLSQEVVGHYHQAMEEFKVSQALQEISRLVARTNKLIDETSPWNLAKDAQLNDVLASTLYHLLESIRIITILYRPFLLSSCGIIFNALGIESADQEFDRAQFGLKSIYHVQSTVDHLFPRLDVTKEVEFIKQSMNSQQPVQTAKPLKPEIGIETFEQINLQVGLVVEATYHPNASKLLILKINTNDKIRQVVSGIAQSYRPEQLIGKKLLVVTNLKPVKLRNELSEGMILCGERDGALYVIEAHADLEVGSQVK